MMNNEEIAKTVTETRAVWSATRRAQVFQDVRRIMREKNIRGSDLAARMGISESNISRLLRGKENPSLEKLYQIADALEVPLRIAMGFEEFPLPIDDSKD